MSESDNGEIIEEEQFISSKNLIKIENDFIDELTDKYNKIKLEVDKLKLIEKNLNFCKDKIEKINNKLDNFLGIIENKNNYLDEINFNEDLKLFFIGSLTLIGTYCISKLLFADNKYKNIFNS